MVTRGPRYEEKDAATGVARFIAYVLLWGGLASAVLVLAGLALYIAHGSFGAQALDLQRATSGRSDHPPAVFVSPLQILRTLVAGRLDPVAIIALGLMLLLITPVVGVSVAIPAFLTEGDRRYAGISLLVVSMLLLSLVVARGAG